MASFPSIFARISKFEHFRGDWAYAERYPKKIFLQKVHFGPITWVPKRFFKISIFFSRNLHFNLGFLSNFRKFYYAHAEHMRKRFYRTLSIRGNDFIAHWAYEERIFAHAQPAVKCEQFLHVIHAEHTRNEFNRTLSIRRTNLIAGWAYAEWISSVGEHTRKCLKVEYLGRIEYDFQKSRVTGPWDHKVSVSAKNF